MSARQRLQALFAGDSSPSTMPPAPSAPSALSAFPALPDAALSALPDPVARFDGGLRRTFVNPALARLVGRTVEEVLGTTPSGLIPTQESQQFENAVASVFATGVPREHLYCWSTGCGQRMASLVRLFPEKDGSGAVVSVLGMGRDITPWYTAARQVEIMHAMGRVCTWEVRLDEPRAAVMAQGGGLFGFDDAGRSPLRYLRRIPREQRTVLFDRLRQAMAGVSSEGIEIDHSMAMPAGGLIEVRSLFRVEHADGRPQRVVGVLHDITRLKSLQRQTHQLTFYDSLTGLPNRAFLEDRMRDGMGHAKDSAGKVGVFLVNVDRFQEINESFGYQTGDLVLRIVGARLKDALREQDTVARLGADEFAVLVSRVRDEADLRNVATRIRRAFEQPIQVADTTVAMSVSAGIAVYPDDGVTQEDLFTHAGAALSHARARGRGNFEFYERQLTEQARQRVKLEADLRQAVERRELVLFYQPKVLLTCGKPVGAEALMRWRRPEVGLVPPDQFIPVAEQTGVIAKMGAWALREACRVAAQWNAGREEPLTIAVNLSPRQFEGGDFSAIVRQALASTGCRPEWIELEITESLLLTDQPMVLAQLSALHDMGVRIAIDDFGTGYSALSYLTRFPIDTLKIDRSFVKALGNGTENAVLVRTIVALAQNLNLEVVAEGVESDEQGQMLRAWNCPLAQGYLYGKPMPEEAFTALLAERVQATEAV